MYLKVTKESKLFDELFNVFSKEIERERSFNVWQDNNLPKFNGETLMKRSGFSLFPYPVGWKFEGEVDKKVWKPVKGYDGYYEPNKRTKAGKEMEKRIIDARGDVFNRMGLFDIFKTDIPFYGSTFSIPCGFIYDNVVYMMFDDGNYNDIKKNCEGEFVEITTDEYRSAGEAYNKSINK